jgi:competence protein ComFB
VEVKNFMEVFVWEMLDQVLEKRTDICRCEICRYDIVALALNDLAPRYVVSGIGETYTRTNVLEQQFRIDVIAKITQAAIIVAQHPRHQ